MGQKGGDGGSVSGASRGRLTPRSILGIVVVVAVVGSAFAVATTAVVGSTGLDGHTGFTVERTDSGGSNATAAAQSDGALSYAIENVEGEQVTYSVVIVREQVVRQDGLAVVSKATVVDRQEVVVAAGATHRFAHDTESVAGETPTRLRAYLYHGDAPDIPSAHSAAEWVQVWLEPLPADSAANGGD